MNKSIALIGVFALVAITAIGLYFGNRAKLVEQEAIMQEQMVILMQEQQRLETSGKKMREEQKASEELARQALQAKKMAEAQAVEERLEREKLVVSLNTQLKREAEERKLAEVAQAELARKIVALETAQAESKAALDALEAERQAKASDVVLESSETNTVALRKKVEAQEVLLAALSEENDNLKEQHAQLEQKQIATEEAIISAGGKIDIPYPEIRSANARRREAIYFKERVAGHPTP